VTTQAREHWALVVHRHSYRLQELCRDLRAASDPGEARRLADRIAAVAAMLREDLAQGEDDA
jgi:hypothetical protein